MYCFCLLLHVLQSHVIVRWFEYTYLWTAAQWTTYTGLFAGTLAVPRYANGSSFPFSDNKDIIIQMFIHPCTSQLLAHVCVRRMAGHVANT